ncbi:MAG: DUF58 domain-containing protein [Deltaproteobacteria bacterium]|nr:DUF58 domain-containing protein [Deltaproteobacteria bacterium]
MRPSRRLMQLLIAWTLVGLLASAWPLTEPFWLVMGGLLLLAVMIDAADLWRLPPLTATRVLPLSMAADAWNTVRLEVLNEAGARRVEFFDHPPEDCALEGLPRTVDIPGSEKLAMEYRVRPRVRGQRDFGRCQALVHGRLGLLRRTHWLAEAEQVKVYPNVQQVARYALLAMADKLGQLGIVRRRRRGEGLEFEQRREYRSGDLIRQIDWKATARHRKLISREYEDERNQQIVFLLDCGRRMRAVDDGVAHFEHVLNAVLLLGHVAIKQGDSVGLMTFSGEERWLPPVRGPVGMSAILNRVYDLQTSTEPADYRDAAKRLMTRQRRRSMVILVSNLRDEDSSELRPALATLRQRHLVLVASLKETALAHKAAGPVDGFRDALTVAAANHYLAERSKSHEALRRGGVMLLDAAPADLPVHLVNAYLDLKRSGRL